MSSPTKSAEQARIAFGKWLEGIDMDLIESPEEGMRSAFIAGFMAQPFEKLEELPLDNSQAEGQGDKGAKGTHICRGASSRIAKGTRANCHYCTALKSQAPGEGSLKVPQKAG